MLRLTSVITFCALLFTACLKEESVVPNDGSTIDERGLVTNAKGTGTPPPSTTMIYGLSKANEIVTLTAGPPVVETASVQLTGLDVDETMLAIDIRSTNRLLYGVSSKSLLYTIDPISGVATRVSTTPFTPEISGTMVGFDFSTKPDLARVVTETHQNMSIDPNTGRVVNVDPNLVPDFLAVNAIAYANNSFGTLNSTGVGQLFDLNTSDGMLYQQYDTKGYAFPIGTTALVITGEGGFDIPNNSTFGFALLNARTSSGVNDSTIPTDDTSIDGFRLYSINTRNGQTTSYGPTREMTGIAVP